MAEEKSFHLSIGSRFENIELVQVVLKDTLERMGLDEDGLYWIDIAVLEAVANAIKHGNRQDPDKRVTVDCCLDGGELLIRVEDQGEGFDLARVDNPLDPQNMLKPNGRGIFYMQKFMDDIQYGAGPAGGTVVTMRKRLGKEEPAPEEPKTPESV